MLNYLTVTNLIIYLITNINKMIEDINNTSTEKSSKKMGLVLFEADKDKYKDVFILYNFIGYKYHRVVQRFKDGEVILFDILSKIPIDCVSEDRTVAILNRSFSTKKDSYIQVQITKIDWNLIYKIIDIFKMRELENTDSYKSLLNNLSKVDIVITTKQIVDIITKQPTNSEIDQRARGRIW